VNNNLLEADKLDNAIEVDLTWPEPEMEELSVGSPLVNDVRVVPEVEELRALSALSSTGSNAPGRYNMSEFLTGSVAVGIILPESAGSAENWSTARRDTVYSEIQDGLGRWVDWSDNNHIDTNKDAVLANVSFTYDYRYAVPVTMEPIQNSSRDDYQWISQSFNNMGFTNSGGWYMQTYDYLEWLRNSNGTDWAMVIFVADSYNDTDGTFTDGYFGYTYGFLTVMTYDNDGWGITNMDMVTQHESAHVFGAADNYSAPGYGGCMNNTDITGYLGIQNSNCEYILNTGEESTSIPNPSAQTDVMMNDNSRTKHHWTGQYQNGWRDTDGDRLADVVDTTPRFNLSLLDGSANVIGVVYDDPEPGYWEDITINEITSASYRVDSGSWTALSAQDGSFNTDYEPVTFNIGSPSIGSHTLDVSVTNSRGNTYVTSQSFTWPPAPPSNDSITSPTVISTLGVSLYHEHGGRDGERGLTGQRVQRW